MANNSRSVMFLSDGTGLAVRGDLWLSMDAGISWTKQLRGRYNCAVLLEDGFAVAGGDQGVLSVSKNAGKTWTEHVLPDFGNVVALASIGHKVVAASQDGALRASRDMAETWQPIDPPQPGFEVIDVEISAQEFMWLLRRPSEQVIREKAYDLWVNRIKKDKRDAREFWLAAEDALMDAALAVSSASGSTWTIADGDYSDFLSVRRLLTDGNALLVGPGTVGLLDGVSLQPLGSFAGTAIDVLDGKTIVCGGYKDLHGFIETSHDGGQSWHTVALADNGVREIFVLDKLRAWAVVGSYGGDMIWGTEDGGLSWKRLTKSRVIEFGGQKHSSLVSAFYEP